MTAAPAINLLVRGEDAARFDRPGVRVLDELSETDAEEIRDLFVLSSALALPEVAPVIKAANRRKHLRGLLVDQDHDPHWVTAMLDRADLRTLRHTMVHTDLEVFERILNAWRIRAQDELIADASVQERLLFVRSCALETFEVDVTNLKPLKNASRDELLDFDVAVDGAHLFWPTLDVHLDLETVRTTLDPKLRQRQREERIKEDELLGQAIKSLRNQADLTQKEIEGISARQVRRLEKGARPRSETLAKFADAHGLELNEYLNRLGVEMRSIRSSE